MFLEIILHMFHFLPWYISGVEYLPHNFGFGFMFFRFICFRLDIQNNICTQNVLKMYFSLNSMNNLSSYCGLTDSRMRASEKDLPVITNIPIQYECA